MKRSAMRRTAWLRRRPSKPIPVRQTGSGIPPDTRLAVVLRDHGHCVSCGVWLANVPSAIHHRLMRSRLGKHGMGNLIHVCDACHRQIHTGDTIQAAEDGLLLPSGSTPTDVPVLTYQGWRWLTDDGRVLTHTEHEGGAA